MTAAVRRRFFPEMTSVNRTVAKTPHPIPWMPIRIVNNAIDEVVVIRNRAVVLAAALIAIVRRTAEARNVEPMRKRAASADAPNTDRDSPMEPTAEPCSAR